MYRPLLFCTSPFIILRNLTKFLDLSWAAKKALRSSKSQSITALRSLLTEFLCHTQYSALHMPFSRPCSSKTFPPSHNTLATQQRESTSTPVIPTRRSKRLSKSFKLDRPLAGILPPITPITTPPHHPQPLSQARRHLREPTVNTSTPRIGRRLRTAPTTGQ